VIRSVQEVAADIRRYCDAHLDACDTLEGIAWWLAIEHSVDEREVVKAAVDYLIAHKLLTPHHLNDGTILFRCSGRATQVAPEAGMAAEDRGG
jgi:hypothetical protein